MEAAHQPYHECVQAQARRAKDAEAAARARLAQAARARKFWEALTAALDAGQPAAALLLARRAADHLGDPGDAAPLLAAVQEDAERQARAQAATFECAFPAAVQAAGTALDSDARHPRYTFHDGFLRVTVDEAAFTATIAPRDGQTTTLALDVEPLVVAVRAELDRLFGRQWDSAAFLRCVYEAYQAMLTAEGLPAGSAVPLRKFTAQLAKQVRRFAADEFNVDLGRLVAAGTAVIDGQRLVLQHTRATRAGMLLRGLEQGGYAGFLSFVPERA